MDWANNDASSAIIFGKNTWTVPTGANELMRITEAGKVGIGTTAPSHELNVLGDANVSATAYMNALNVDDAMSADKTAIATQTNISLKADQSIQIASNSPVYCAAADTDACTAIRVGGVSGFATTDGTGAEIFKIRLDKNFTMYSTDDGSDWNCGVSRTGQFNCGPILYTLEALVSQIFQGQSTYAGNYVFTNQLAAMSALNTISNIVPTPSNINVYRVIEELNGDFTEYYYTFSVQLPFVTNASILTSPESGMTRLPKTFTQTQVTAQIQADANTIIQEKFANLPTIKYENPLNSMWGQTLSITASTLPTTTTTTTSTTTTTLFINGTGP